MASSKSLEQRNSAEAKKADRERDAQIATREYHAEKARVDANTARLRALRLAQEAANPQSAVVKPVTAKKAKPAAAKKAKPAPDKPAAEKKAAARVSNPARRASLPRSSS
ncbi:MAG: hypothetical protein QOG38_691 [Hyphomicrobiales bacterium]|nr:hypothetical protein [Hyphomicrobiales bacterium]